MRRSTRSNRGRLPAHLRNYVIGHHLENLSSADMSESEGEDNQTVIENTPNNDTANLNDLIASLCAQVRTLETNLSVAVNELKEDRTERQHLNAQLGNQRQSIGLPQIEHQQQLHKETRMTEPQAQHEHVPQPEQNQTSFQGNVSTQTFVHNNTISMSSAASGQNQYGTSIFQNANLLPPATNVLPQLPVGSIPASCVTVPSTYFYQPNYSYGLQNVSMPPTSTNFQIPAHLNWNSMQSHWQNQQPSQSNFPAVPMYHDSRRKLHDLPEFRGKPEEWPMFVTTFRESTAAFGYSPLENTMRLQKCLKGEARECVESLLIHPNNVDEIVSQLEFRFGRPEYLIKSQIEKVRGIPPISENCIYQIIPFATKVKNLSTFLETTASFQHMSNPMLIEEIINKLPMSKKFEWAQVAIQITPFPTIRDVSAWLDRTAQLVSLVVVSQSPSKDFIAENRPQKKNVMLHVNDQSSEKTINCVNCAKDHFIAECREFQKLPMESKWNIVKSKMLCFSCLKSGHNLHFCRRRKACGIDNCRRPHHHLLHENVTKKSQLEFENEASTPTRASENKMKIPVTCQSQKPVLSCQPDLLPEVLFKVVPVKLFGARTEINTFAFLDDGSTVTMIDEDIAKQLDLDGESESLTLKWFGNKTTTEMSKTVNMQISGTGKKLEKFQLNNVRTIKNLQLPMQTLNLNKLNTKYHHLKNLPIADYSNARPQILIGLDNLHIGLPNKSVNNSQDEPVVIQTKLGWVVYGPTNLDTKFVLHSQAVVLHAQEVHNDYAEIHNIVKEYFTTENFGVQMPQAKLESKSVMRARQIMETTTVRVGDHFETGLLWRDDVTQLPNSLPMAIHRLEGVENKMRKDPEYAAKYNENIRSYVEKGYARLMTPEEVQSTTARTWYLPHFGVCNPAKPNKLRLVFDAAAAVNGVSLNSTLLTGPDQYQPLTSILHKFRKGQIAVCGDIREMFHQVLIRKEDQNAQRFVWRNGDPSQPILTYVMVAMTFGATCSPSSAQFVKNKNAVENQQEVPRAVKAIIENHYVDDYVMSFPSEDDALVVSQDVIRVHKKGGFELRNFVSNSKRVRDILNETAVNSISSNINMSLEGEIKTEKILGMHWDTANDEFRFDVKFHRVNKEVLNRVRRPTKKEMLSIIMSVFDPFGFLANFLIHMKILMQEIWRYGIDWNSPVPDPVYGKWLSWRDELENVKKFHVPRCYSPKLSETADVQLHIFVDASQAAFAAAAYFRITSINEPPTVSFVSGKTKCAPQKLLSIPRLELQAAVLGVRLKNTILECHDFPIKKIVLWSDSKTVIQWIQSEHRQYKQFVALRIAEILESTDIINWRWIPTKLNVADDATRAVFPPKFDGESRWIIGPNFLKEEEEFWPITPSEINQTLCREELQVKFSEVYNISLTKYAIELEHFSDYNEARRVLAWMLRFFYNQRANIEKQAGNTGELSIHEIQAAETRLCQWAQVTAYCDEINDLQLQKQVKKSSPIFNLTPVLGENNVVRVGGRIDNASSIPVSARRPIILPSDHPLTQLIVKTYHRQWHHQNQETIISEIRQKFWIPNLRSVVRKAKALCQLCKIKAAKPCVPQMGQLPEDRLTPYVRPFSYTGVDFFGPVYVTVGRRQEKRWVALFTCLTVRAIHLELSSDLSTDAFILCIRNFINRRGVPVRIRSDNASNFVGASKELHNTADFLDHEQLKLELSTKGIEWIFNCPGDPSAGGCWERLVQSVKKILRYSLKEIAPRVETLRSLLIEAENIVNSRPLTHIPVTIEDEEPLTPNHFLLGTSNSTQTPILVDNNVLGLRKQWRISQQLKNCFWRRWIAEYLPTLTRRTKWFKKVEPLKINDLVIICDSDSPRSRWYRGRIIRVFPSKDGQTRSAEVRTSHGILRRPASKLAVLDVDELDLNQPE